MPLASVSAFGFVELYVSPLVEHRQKLRSLIPFLHLNELFWKRYEIATLYKLDFRHRNHLIQSDSYL